MTMYCVNCDNKKPLKQKRINYKYTDCGLENVTLHGVEYTRCDKCGEDYVGYGDLEQLHAQIAAELIQKKGLLDGKEVRFLRSHMGYSGATYARLVGMTSEHQSRIENGRTKATQAYDLLLRALVQNKTPDRHYDLHDLITNDSGKELKRIDLKLNGHGWESAA